MLGGEVVGEEAYEKILQELASLRKKWLENRSRHPPPTHARISAHKDVKKRVETTITKELAHRLLAPSIVLTEFVKIAGTRMGESAARLRLGLLKERGMRVLLITEEMALVAGSILLAHQDVPIADALIASLVQTRQADYVVTDDPYDKVLGVRTKWV